MKSITFNGNDEEIKKFIDDYHWFKYYVQTVLSDIDNTYCQKEHLKMEIVRKCLNQAEFDRLINIHKYLLKHHKEELYFSDFDNYDYGICALWHIKSIGYKRIISLFIKLLLDKSKISLEK